MIPLVKPFLRNVEPKLIRGFVKPLENIIRENFVKRDDESLTLFLIKKLEYPHGHKSFLDFAHFVSYFL